MMVYYCLRERYNAHTYMLNSAQGVTFPIRDFSPGSLLIGAVVKPSPIAPPIMLKPWICSTTSGKVANRRAILVIVPVAITQGVPLGWARRASRMARIGFLSVTGGRVAFGKRSVPSRPDSPIKERRSASPKSHDFLIVSLPWILGAWRAGRQKGFRTPG